MVEEYEPMICADFYTPEGIIKNHRIPYPFTDTLKKTGKWKCTRCGQVAVGTR